MIDRSSFFVICLKFMKNNCINSYMNILTRFIHQNNMGFEKDIASALSNGYAKKIQRIKRQGRRIWLSLK